MGSGRDRRVVVLEDGEPIEVCFDRVHGQVNAVEADVGGLLHGVIGDEPRDLIGPVGRGRDEREEGEKGGKVFFRNPRVTRG